MKNACIWFFLLGTVILCAAEEKDALIRDGARRRQPLYRFETTNWKFSSRDIAGSEKTGLDDSAWDVVEIGKPLQKKLAVSGRNGPVVWYRKTFHLERKLPELVWFEPGYISAGDTIYLNGEQICSTPHRGATFKCRRYLLKNAPFKQGQNLLAVRVQLGYMKGMYNGTPQIYGAELPQLLTEFLHKNSKADVLKRHLTGNGSINIFPPGESVRVQEKLFSTSDREQDCRIVYRLNRCEKTAALKLLPRTPAVADMVEFPSPGAGCHQMESSIYLDGKLYSRRHLKFRVEPHQIFTVPEEKLPVTANLRINEFSLGSNGPRTLYRRVFLADKPNAPEIRGAAAGALAVGKKANGALMLFTHIDTPSGNWKFSDYDNNLGARYDGLNTVRLLGAAELPGKKLKQFSVDSCSWTMRRYRFDYGRNQILNCSINQLAPGWLFQTRSGSLRLFRSLEESGSAAPGVLYPGAVKQLDDLKQNYFVVSWKNRSGWNQIDLPMVVVLEHRPQKVTLDHDGVLLSFAGEAGRVWVVPLYGVTPRPAGVLGRKELERAARIASLIPGLPVGVKRFISVDWQRDRLLIRDSFTYEPWQDDWNTPVVKYAPLPPGFVLASSGKLIRLSSGKKVQDCDYALNAGPLCVTAGEENVMAIDGLTKFVREQRELAATGKTDPELAAQLDDYVSRALPELEKHPWRIFRSSGRDVTVGSLEPEFTNLLLAMPFLKEKTRQRLQKAIDLEAEQSFTNDSMQVGGKRRKKKTAITHHVTNRVTGKVLAAPCIHVHQGGIDGPCWIGNQISLLWNYARYCGRLDYLKQRKAHFERYLNTLINSSDWAYSVSWDSHSGIRVGNGLQESTIFYAAFAAAAQFYHLCGETQMRDRMAAYAMIQLAGISAVVNPVTNRWLREKRPWLATHPDAVQIARDERLMPDHFLEFNERGGLFHSIMRGSGEPLFSDSWIMTRTPQVMRPFKELWGRASDAHYRPTLPDPRFELPVPVDTFLYMTPQPPVPVEQQFQIRMAFPMKDADRIADLRALLEYRRGTVWRALW